MNAIQNIGIYHRIPFTSIEYRNKFDETILELKKSFGVYFCDDCIDLIGLDCIVSFGGDGTMLGACRNAVKYGIPVLGINYGTLGFITSLSINDNLIAVLNGNYNLEKRTLIQLQNQIALNDILFQRDSSRLVEFEVYVDNVFAYGTRADGILVSTPTGSTAYALSSGGSILHPNSKVLQITPLHPQTLSNKPLIIPDDSNIKIYTKNECSIFVDGIEMSYNGLNEITKYKDPVEFMIPAYTKNNFYSSLRNKLHWQVPHR